jgi:outer membrane protein assembly factor BamE (lipoprotein component of BamABCDE complex)
MLKTFMVLIVVVLITGCATSSKKLNRLNVGMSKAEVVHILGTPESTRATRGVEFLVFNLRERIARPGEAIAPIGINEKYFVKLFDGKVESYGHLGDFDSTKPFETKHEIDVNVREK